MTFGLQRALTIAAHFREHNLFFYPNESREWLDASEKTVVLANDLYEALTHAVSDENALYGAIRARSDRMENLVTDDLVLIARLKAGATRSIAPQQAYDTEMALWEVQVAQAREEGRTPPPRPDIAPPAPSPLTPVAANPEQAFREYFDKRKHIEEFEAKNAIRDASLLMMLYKGIRRRRLKLAHNVEVLDQLVNERLYVPSTTVENYIRDLVFKGLWESEARGSFERLVRVFVAMRPWSQRARATASEWAAIAARARTVTDQRGRVYSSVVEESLFRTGIAV